MKTPKPIIAGIDFSPASPMVLRHAGDLAAAAGAPLIAVHVVDDSRKSHWLAGRKPDSGQEDLSDRAEDKLKALIAAEPSAKDAKIIIRSGRPSEELQAVIKDKEVGLLVIAANDLSKKRLGLTASRSVRVVDCDVLVLRDWQEPNFRKIVTCIDLSRNATKVIERGIEAAIRCGATLDIVHVLYPPDQDLWGEAVESEASHEDFTRHTRAHVSAAIESALQPFQEQLKGIEFRTKVLEATSPALELTSYAEGSGADLVVLGTRGHSKLGAHFLGTNTERLLHDTPLSVLAVRV